VRVGGHDVRDLRLESLRARIGLVTQDVHVFPATLRDNLTFFDGSVGDDRLLAALRALGLAEWLARLPAGLDTHIAADSLSAGEAQLVAFARVFLKEPGLLILDEPSSRLDPVTEALLGTAIDALLRNRTAIVITHRLETLRRANEIVLIDEGRILERGATAELLDDESSRFATLLRAREGAL
jgi:ATP-binding cassette subfamily B protein/ATP-binding cassette subfamily C protein